MPVSSSAIKGEVRFIYRILYRESYIGMEFKKTTLRSVLVIEKNEDDVLKRFEKYKDVNFLWFKIEKLQEVEK